MCLHVIPLLLILNAWALLQIQHMYRCARVQGLDTSEGLLLFGKEHFYVIDGFTMTATREIRDIETLPPKWVQLMVTWKCHSTEGQFDM